MVNDKRIVSITAIDLLTNYSVILNAAGKSLVKLEAENTGEFTVADGTGDLFANEPVKTLDVADGVTAATVYFVPAFDFAGFTKNGEEQEITGDIDPDGRTLYKLTVTASAFTVEAVGL